MYILFSTALGFVHEAISGFWKPFMMALAVYGKMARNSKLIYRNTVCSKLIFNFLELRDKIT
jgi:hypothetical protein